VLYVALGWGWELKPLQGDTLATAGTDGYVQIAHTWLHTGQFAYAPGTQPAHNRPPLTPVLMAVFGAWWPAGWFAVWMGFQVGLALLCTVLVHRLLQHYGVQAGWRGALLATFLLHPFWLMAVRNTTFVMPAATLLLAAWWLYLRPGKPAALTRYLWLGVAFGGLALTHGSLQVVGGVWVAAMLLAQGFRRQVVLRLGLVLLAAVATVAPWAMRNYAHWHTFLPVATGLAAQYWKGEAEYVGQDDLSERTYAAYAGQPLRWHYFGTLTPQQEEPFKRAMWEHIAQHPAHFAARTAEGLWVFWAPNDKGLLKQVLAGACTLPWVLLLLWGLARAWRKKRHRTHPELLAWGACILAVNGVFALLYGNVSYYVMLVPLLLVAVGALFAAPKPPHSH
jgi:4-amino-4-deoxy-L-arabinose transferase-like glycosyltransferase